MDITSDVTHGPLPYKKIRMGGEEIGVRTPGMNRRREGQGDGGDRVCRTFSFGGKEEVRSLKSGKPHNAMPLEWLKRQRGGGRGERKKNFEKMQPTMSPKNCSRERVSTEEASEGTNRQL